MKIKGAAFIVTGGASGLGEAVVRNVVGHGGFAVIFDRQENLANALVKELGDDKVIFANVDVTSEGTSFYHFSQFNREPMPKVGFFDRQYLFASLITHIRSVQLCLFYLLFYTRSLQLM